MPHTVRRVPAVSLALVLLFLSLFSCQGETRAASEPVFFIRDGALFLCDETENVLLLEENDLWRAGKGISASCYYHEESRTAFVLRDGTLLSFSADGERRELFAKVDSLRYVKGENAFLFRREDGALYRLSGEGTVTTLAEKTDALLSVSADARRALVLTDGALLRVSETKKECVLERFTAKDRVLSVSGDTERLLVIKTDEETERLLFIKGDTKRTLCENPREGTYRFLSGKGYFLSETKGEEVLYYFDGESARALCRPTDLSFAEKRAAVLAQDDRGTHLFFEGELLCTLPEEAQNAVPSLYGTGAIYFADTEEGRALFRIEHDNDGLHGPFCLGEAEDCFFAETSLCYRKDGLWYADGCPLWEDAGEDSVPFCPPGSRFLYRKVPTEDGAFSLCRFCPETEEIETLFSDCQSALVKSDGNLLLQTKTEHGLSLWRCDARGCRLLFEGADAILSPVV